MDGASAHPDVEAVTAVYQPVVELSSRRVVGYEALARGARQEEPRQPKALFAAARRDGRLVELDWTCRAAAFRGALAPSRRVPWTLFVNVEPEALGSDCPPSLAGLVASGPREVRTIFEITERALTDHPAELLRVVEELRAAGAGIALDDVGADWRSLALMPLIRPDVVKLDLHLIQRPLTPEATIIAEAVRAYASQSGAAIVAEGIETEAHLERARGLGAGFGQGWLFGRPGELPESPAPELSAAPGFIIAPAPPEDDSPFEAIARIVETAVAPKVDLLAFSHGIEQRAAHAAEPCVVLTAFEERDRFTPRTARLYSELARRSAFVAVFGRGMPDRPAPEVRGADPDLNDQLGEWAVVLVGPHYAVALVAEDLGDDGPDLDRRYRFAVLNDREVVLRAARSLIRRTRPVTPAHAERQDLAA